MPDASVGIKIKADHKQAVAAIKETSSAIDAMGDEIVETNTLANKNADALTAAWKEVAIEVAKSTKKIKLAADESQKITSPDKLDRWAKLSMVFQGLSQGIATAASSLSSAGRSFYDWTVSGAAKIQTAQIKATRLTGSEAEGRAVVDQASAFGMSAGLDPTQLMEHTGRLIKAGYQTQQAISAVQSAWIAAGRDATIAEMFIDQLGEAAAGNRDELEARIDAFAGEGVNLRKAMAEVLGVPLEGLSDALKTSGADFQTVVAALEKLTGEGTPLFEAFAAGAYSLEGRMATLQTHFAAVGEEIGMALLPTFERFATTLQGLTSALAGVDGRNSLASAVDFVVEAVSRAIKVFVAAGEQLGKVWDFFLHNGGGAIGIAKGLISGEIQSIFGDFTRRLYEIDRAENEARHRARKNAFSGRSLSGVAPVIRHAAIPARSEDPAKAAEKIAAAAVPTSAPAALSPAAGAAPALASLVPSAPEAPALRESSVASSLFSVGGGGRSVNFYEAQKVEISRQTLRGVEAIAAHTSAIAKNFMAGAPAILA